MWSFESTGATMYYSKDSRFYTAIAEQGELAKAGYSFLTYINRTVVKRLRIAGHGFLLPLIDVRHHSLLMHGDQLVFLGVTLLFKRLHSLLESKQKYLIYNICYVFFFYIAYSNRLHISIQFGFESYKNN